MKKQDIINEINASERKQAILEEGKPEQFGICKTYTYTVLIGDTETANIEKISFYVLNEGAQDEAAYWRPGMKARLYPTPADVAQPEAV